ncbi:MAG: glycosyltransferase [Magnetococcales bacterium]|nr:glycosyltransferase [Magnetococcales bacterium]
MSFPLATPPPMVSVIVCVYNDADRIAPCIQSLLDQDYPPESLEVVVVDDGSTDQTAAVVRQFPAVRLCQQENRGPSTARNLGILQARGEICAFTDSDCEADPGWVRSLVQHHMAKAGERFGGVGGSQFGHPGDPPFARKVDRYLRAVGLVGDYVKPHAAACPVLHNASCNASYPRRLLLEVGGFRPGLFPGEDVELDKRLENLGYRLWFEPQARVFHHRVNTPARWINMLRSYGRSQAEVVRLHGFFRLIHFVPPVGVLSLFMVLGVSWQYHLWIHAALLALAGTGLVIGWLKHRSGLGLLDTTVFFSTTLRYYFPPFFKALLGISSSPIRFDQPRLQPLIDPPGRNEPPSGTI